MAETWRSERSATRRPGQVRIDLPVPPSALQPEPTLQGAAVRVFLFEEAAISGRLLGADGNRGVLVLETAADVRRVLPLDGVRAFSFPRRLLGMRSAGRQEALTQVEVGFRDGRQARFACIASIQDALGLHLFVGRRGAAFRLCIPAQAVSTVRYSEDGLDAPDRPATAAVALPQPAALLAPVPDSPSSSELLAARLGLPVADLLHRDTDRSLLDEIPAALAREHRVLPLGRVGEHLRVAMAAPSKTETLQLLQFLTGRSLLVEVADEAALLHAVDESYEFLDQDHDFDVLEASASVPAEQESRELESLAAAKPVVRLVNNILLEAVRRNASDVHIRPGDRDVELIFRIDGDLVPVRRFSRSLLRAVVSRIKVLGQMDLTEHRVPQDGQARLRDRGTDLRISVIPSIEGDSVVIRLLRATVGMKDLTDLGMTAADTQRLRDALDRSHGMLLVTGPTGSGKSTTLYAALKAVMQRNVNIITLENPVEYHIPGIVQIPINAEVGMTFAAALRNVLRHDPDVVMVGEIRDRETARIAVESALTGHLLLSTLHTNSAVSTITRLIEMDVESYLLRGTLLGVLAQRLVRRICPQCKVLDTRPQAHMRELLGVSAQESFHHGTGCKACGGTGVRGRCMTYEYLTITPALRQLIAPAVDERLLAAQALQDGMTPLGEHALGLARAGIISLEEAYRSRLE